MSYQAVVLAESSLLSYYRLGEASGTVATDLGTRAQNGTLHGTITLGQTGLIKGDAGTCYLFNGSTGYVSCPTTGLPTGANPWSIECWVKFPTLPSNNFNGLASFGSFASGSAALYYRGGNQNFELWHAGTGSHIDGPNGQGQAGAIYHLVGTYNGSTVTLYVNGASVASATSITLNMVQSFSNIGVDDTGDGDYTNGLIQEVAFYSTALSAAQVATHYNVGNGVVSLVSSTYWSYPYES